MCDETSQTSNLTPEHCRANVRGNIQSTFTVLTSSQVRVVTRGLPPAVVSVRREIYEENTLLCFEIYALSIANIPTEEKICFQNVSTTFLSETVDGMMGSFQYDSTAERPEFKILLSSEPISALSVQASWETGSSSPSSPVRRRCDRNW